MSAPTEPLWKHWLDRLLMLNVLLVASGAVFFTVAVVAQSQGRDRAMDLFQQLWQPPRQQCLRHVARTLWTGARRAVGRSAAVSFSPYD